MATLPLKWPHLSVRFSNLARDVEAESFRLYAQAVDHEKRGEGELAHVFRELAREARRRAKGYRRFGEHLRVMFDC